jgi:DNA-binding FadR family transcriptional regulator
VTTPAVDLSGVLRPVRTGNAFEETVERLLTAIKLGLIGPGERFPAERELAAQLGISRLTLREAIHELTEAGYVCSKRGRFGGTFVTYQTPALESADLRRLARQNAGKLTDALVARQAIESGAAEILARRFASAWATGDTELGPMSGGAPGAASTDGGGKAQETLLARLAEVAGASPQDYRRMDTLFHLCIAELTGSTLLVTAATDARMLLNDLLNAIPVLPRNIAHAERQHAAIVESILAGDADRARREVAEHLDATAALLRGFLA